MIDLTATADSSGAGARAEVGYRLGDATTLYGGVGVDRSWNENASWKSGLDWQAGVGLRVRF